LGVGAARLSALRLCLFSSLITRHSSLVLALVTAFVTGSSDHQVIDNLGTQQIDSSSRGAQSISEAGGCVRGGWASALPVLPSPHFASFFSDVTAFVTGPSMTNPATSRWIDEPILRPQPIRNQPFPNLPPYVYLSFYQ